MAIRRLKLLDKDNEDDKFYGWKVIHEMILNLRGEEGYDSATVKGS